MTDKPTNGAAAALARVAAEMKGIDKDERNTQQNFNFRSIDAITAAVRPLFGKHGLAILPSVAHIEYETIQSRSNTAGYRCIATVDYLIVHESGDQLAARMVGEAADYGDKSTSKAVQMAFKYLLTELLMVGSGDTDPDSKSVDDLAHHAPEVDPEEVAERATNKLKGDMLTLFGDREAAVAAYRQTVTSLGFDPEGPVPVTAHADILALAKTMKPKGAAVAAAKLVDAEDDTRPFET